MTDFVCFIEEIFVFFKLFEDLTNLNCQTNAKTNLLKKKHVLVSNIFICLLGAEKNYLGCLANIQITCPKQTYRQTFAKHFL